MLCPMGSALERSRRRVACYAIGPTTGYEKKPGVGRPRFDQKIGFSQLALLGVLCLCVSCFIQLECCSIDEIRECPGLNVGCVYSQNQLRQIPMMLKQCILPLPLSPLLQIVTQPHDMQSDAVQEVQCIIMLLNRRSMGHDVFCRSLNCDLIMQI